MKLRNLENVIKPNTTVIFKVLPYSGQGEPLLSEPMPWFKAKLQSRLDVIEVYPIEKDTLLITLI